MPDLTLEERLAAALETLSDSSPATFVTRADGRELFTDALAAIREKDAEIARLREAYGEKLAKSELCGNCDSTLVCSNCGEEALP